MKRIIRVLLWTIPFAVVLAVGTTVSSCGSSAGPTFTLKGAPR